MSHLSPSEFIELAEDALDPRRAAHADTCDACRAQAAVVRDALRMSETAEAVPEPSPLFWDHLAARVHAAVAAEPQPRAMGVFGRLGLRPLVPTLALAVAIFSVALWTRDVRPDAGAERSAPGAARMGVDAAPDTDTSLDGAHEEVWAVLTAAAADLQIEEARAAGMALQPAAVDRAVQRLTAAELAELGRLLQSELKRSSN